MYSVHISMHSTVDSLTIENEPAAVLNFLSGSQWLHSMCVLSKLMTFSVLNSAPSRHSRLRAVAASLAARLATAAWGSVPAHRGGAPVEGFDYHLAEALDEEEMSDHCSSSSEEDENNEAVSWRSRPY